MTVVARWHALGTTAEVLADDPARLAVARAAVVAELAAVDRACSRFRPDSALSRLNVAAGTGPVAVAPLLLEAVRVALDAARRTGGAVDPTVGRAIRAAGYDRDLAAVAADGPAFVPRPAPGVDGIVVDEAAGTIALPAGVELDLGATAKALAADRAARAALRASIIATGPGRRPGVHADPRVAGASVVEPSGAAGAGVLVSLGGDVAVAGPAPGDGWPVGIADDHRDRRPVHVVDVRSGGLATSGLTARRWRRGGRTVHHVLDPRTGAPVAPVWRTVTVAAPSCVDANTWSTAALVLGAGAPDALGRAGVAARLVAGDGTVVTVGGWPAESAPPPAPVRPRTTPAPARSGPSAPSSRLVRRRLRVPAPPRGRCAA